MELKRIAYCERLRKDQLSSLMKTKRSFFTHDDGEHGQVKASKDSDETNSVSTSSEDAVSQADQVLLSLTYFKENIEAALIEGRIVEILSMVQSLRIFLQEEQNHLPFQKFLNAELLPLILPFLNYKSCVFGDLISETLSIIGILSMGNEAVVRTIIQEGYLRRLKMSFMESITYPKEFSTIVFTLANMAGTGKPGQITELLEVSGVIDTVVQEAKRFYGHQEICQNLVWLYSNLLQTMAAFRDDKKRVFVSEIFHSLNSMESPSKKSVVQAIWGAALFVENKPDSEENVEFLKSLNVMKEICLFFQTDFPTDLLPAYSRLIARFSYHFDICNEFITGETCEVK